MRPSKSKQNRGKPAVTEVVVVVLVLVTPY